nr:Chain A, GH10 Xylanase [Globitermes brachycerastes]4HU8_B Chain B, GH10 Xylanase [Globitermes brachycerastes]4HU8_C Chain C, GH10 Xylanase [Globitermes brachycerastes]4HU8_D Chain D, GH10 Xylanase [Globitermes brachycerastes]4HU8_E Chain E, GH10 Xylanase [Globitermes brachycerastes]4HU8_F Chain F, GH10 Xylanase [Globitermes brachycerastes]4HU8_G Chain G, GH10 Xylanase [Globitermes brachycerastes]4HU8_H Chain H, GH10 Xylanase [Globitermes brachycerastes]
PPNEITLTIGQQKDLASMVPAKFAGQELSWTSSDPETASVTDKGIVTALKFSSGGANLFLKAPATGEAIITVTAGKQSHSVKVITTVKGKEDIEKLPPLKDHFKDYFLIGNIFNNRDVSGSMMDNDWLAHHYAILTPENHMKPSNLTNNRNETTGEITYTFSTADRMVNAAIAEGLKIHGHTLLWHQQIPPWQRSMESAAKDAALSVMKKYITEVMTHYKGKIYSWDVLNEIFPDGRGDNWTTAMRPENPWFKSIGSDFVYEAYLAARQADPNAILYYNDYNMDQAGKAALIAAMVRDVNAKYKQAYPRETRLLIEGIGMQSHHNMDVPASNIRNTINRYRELGVKISVSELDILCMGWSAFRGSTGQGADKDDMTIATNRNILDQAYKFNEYMKLYLENSDIIERVSMWGVSDRYSWRSGGLPLLFDADNKAKPAYYSFVRAREDYEAAKAAKAE